MNQDPFNDAFDACMILLMATLFLAVIFVEWRRGRGQQSLLPPQPGHVRTDRSNVPIFRNANERIEAVGFMDVDDTAEACA